MNKKDLATLQFEHRQLSQMSDDSQNRLIEIIQVSFSALATIDPSLALEVLDQLNNNKEDMENLVTERAEEKAKYVDALSSKLPDSLDLED